MEVHLLINECRNLLNAAEHAQSINNHENYSAAMSSLLDLLIKELVGDAPAESPAPGPEPAAEPPAEPEQQGDKAKSDAVNRRKAGNSPW